MNVKTYLLASSLLFPILIVTAQTAATSYVPSPKAVDLLNARRAFIAFHYMVIGPQLLKHGLQQAYDEFYAAMKQWGRYELVPQSKDADVVSPSRMPNPLLQILVLATDSRSVDLWGFSEGVPANNNDEKFSKSIAALIKDIQQVVGTARPGGSAQP